MLITLVIIGVIAALTIPNLLQKYQEQATVKKVQKFYSNLSNAYALASKENGPLNDLGLTGYNTTSSQKIYEIIFKPYFKIAKDCGGDNTGECIPNVPYKLLNNAGTGVNYSIKRSFYKIALDDGAAIFWRENDNLEVEIYYDVNGQKEPNQYGRDLFTFIIKTNNNKIMPSGIQSGEYSIYPFNQWCKMTSQGYGCAAWVVYKGNMDYLHCDLTWDKNSCKDK